MSRRSRLAYVAAVLTLLLGLFALILPYWMILLLPFEFAQTRPWGVSELQATYGAMVVAMGGVTLWALPLRPKTSPYLKFAGLLWLAGAAGRVLSILIHGTVTPLNFAALGLELLIGVPLLLAGFETPRRREAAGSEVAKPPYV